MRLLRKNIYTQCKSKGGLLDLFDNEIKLIFRINDEQYDAILNIATDEELDVLTNKCKSFKDKRILINTLENLINRI